MYARVKIGTYGASHVVYISEVTGDTTTISWPRQYTLSFKSHLVKILDSGDHLKDEFDRIDKMEG